MNKRLLGLGSSPAGLMFLYKEEDIPGMQEARKGHGRMQRKTAICKPRREASEETSPADLRLPGSRTLKDEVLLFKHPVHGPLLWQPQWTCTACLKHIVSLKMATAKRH